MLTNLDNGGLAASVGLLDPALAPCANRGWGARLVAEGAGALAWARVEVDVVHFSSAGRCQEGLVSGREGEQVFGRQYHGGRGGGGGRRRWGRRRGRGLLG